MVYTLGQVRGEGRGAPPLRSAGGYRDTEVRGLAACALEDLREGCPAELLVRLLEERDAGVRYRAAAALEKRAWKPGTQRRQDLLAIAKGELHPAALRELAARYGFEGMAKHGDELAMQQFGWATCKERDLLPTRDSLLPMARSLEAIREREGVRMPEADTRMLARRPDLRVQYLAQVVREHYAFRGRVHGRRAHGDHHRGLPDPVPGRDCLGG